jgi:outer membrane protein OmpA-like peptidoglycan-associated protein
MNPRMMATVGTALLLVLLTVSCATKKYVRANVTDLEAKISGVDKKVDQKTDENGARITDLDRKTETGIAAAQKSAEDAGQQASKAESDAQAAHTLAQQGVDQANQVGQELQNVDNFKPLKSETILFKVGRYTLTDEDKQQLDTFAQTTTSLKRYLVQVQGFTDSTGSKSSNVLLSQRRAEAVVRYLTEDYKVPLIWIRYLGYGEEMPSGDNKSRDGRQQNRRVVVTVLAPPQMAASNATPQRSTAVPQ